MITNAQIVQTIKDAIEPLDFVYGLFEGGAIAFGRDDEYSDIDLHIVAADDQVTAVLPIIEKALVELGPLRDKYEVPQPTWHGHHQTFFRLEGHPDWLMVDCAVINHSAEDKFLEPEVHGHHVVHFDKTGIHESLPVYDYSKTEEAIKSRLQSMGPSMQMFSHLPSKFLLRGKNIDAIHFYNGFILRPLLVLLRIKYDPKRYDLSARYLYDYLPEGDVLKFEQLHFVASPEDLGGKIDEALVWFWELHAEMTERYSM